MKKMCVVPLTLSLIGEFTGSIVVMDVDNCGGDLYQLSCVNQLSVEWTEMYGTFQAAVVRHVQNTPHVSDTAVIYPDPRRGFVIFLYDYFCCTHYGRRSFICNTP